MNKMIGKFRRFSGFSLPQLLVALLLSAIVVLAIYRNMMKGVGSMSQTTKINIMRRNATVAINAMATDMKLIGYNPSAQVNSSNNPLYGLRSHDSASNDEIRYSLYTDPSCNCSDPAFEVETTCPRNSGDPNISCCCERYFMNGSTLIKEYYDFSPSVNGKNSMTLVNNACVKFLLWDGDNDEACVCQDSTFNFSKCPDSLPKDGMCTVADDNIPPRVIKIILAVVPKSHFAGASNFDSMCNSTILKPEQYVRVEKKVYLANYK